MIRDTLPLIRALYFPRACLPLGYVLITAGLGGYLAFFEEGPNWVKATGNSLLVTFRGTISDAHGDPIINSGLWSLKFGNAGNNGDPNTLFFTAGINGEADGLFGSLRPVPEPATLVLLGVGVLSVCGLRWRRAARLRTRAR